MEIQQGYKTIGSQRIYHEFYFQKQNFKTIVLLHEGLGSVAQWKGIPIKIFQRISFNVLVYDRSGYGKSGTVNPEYPNDYLRYEAYHILPQLLNALDIKICGLFGHSDGGSIALLFAANNPKRCLFVFSEAAHVIIEDMSRQGIARVRKLYQRTLKKPLEKYHKEKTDWVFYHWADTWLNPKYHKWNMQLELQNIQCPVVAIQGDKDEYGSPKQLHLIKENCTHAQTHLIENCGHIPHFEQWDIVEKYLRDIID